MHTSALGYWYGEEISTTGNSDAPHVLYALETPVYAVASGPNPKLVSHGHAVLGNAKADAPGALPLLGYAPPLPITQLGDPAFARAYDAK